MFFSDRNFKCLILLILIIGISCCLTRQGKINRLFKNYNGRDVPGASLMVIKDGQPVFTKTYGLANVEEKIPVECQTNFRLASFTKQFTAMCIAMIAEQGKLSYEQTLIDIFPDFPEYGRAITVDHIIHHTSGLIDYESLIPDTATIQVLDKDVLNMMMKQDSTYFLPGTEYRYSNSGYAVLTKIVEKTSGKSFAEFLKENIFIPLQMINTVAYEKGISTLKHRAFGYAVENRELIFKDQSLTSAVLGDGGIYSSVLDLYKWDQALYTDSLVSFETLQKIFTPGFLKDSTQLEYGFGWRIDEYKGHHRMHHTGQTCGFSTIIQRYPEDKLTIIILTNRNKPMLNDIADKIAELFL